MNTIAIVGSTGMIGQPVTKAFVDAGFRVTLLVRDAEKARRLFGSSVAIMNGDLAEMATVKRFLDGQEWLYLSLSVEPDHPERHFHTEREGLDNILRAARESHIKRIGFLSSLVHRYQGQNGFNWWVFEIKRQAVAKIKECGLPYTIFYPSTFMEVFDKGGYRQGNKITLVGDSKQRMFFIAGRDYGRQAVRAFQLDNGNQEYAVQGPEGFTADEVAKLWVDHYEKTKIKMTKVPLGLLQLFGKFSRTYDYAAHIVDSLNNYPETFESERTWQDLGKPQTTFIEYIKQA
jgi:uncharacterized protein YbjT (DUF2867 family)